MAEKVKVSVNLTPSEVATLKELARKRETTVTETLRRAIAMEKFIDQATSSGKSLLLNWSHGGTRLPPSAAHGDPVVVSL